MSPRQREILDLVAEGRTSKEIASALGISESTVNWHLANVFAKLGASSRAEAVARAYVANGHEPQRPPTPVSTPKVWPRFIAITIAVAIAAALLGGATVATFRVGPVPIRTSPPANSSDRAPTPSPAGGAREDLVGAEMIPGAGVDVGADPIGGPLPESPATIRLAVSAPPLPSESVPVATPALPSLPVTLPPLPSLPLPTPIPTPRLSLP